MNLPHSLAPLSGVSPLEMKGTNTAVFVGGSSNEAKEVWENPDKSYTLTGTAGTMTANFISYAFDLKGTFKINLINKKNWRLVSRVEVTNVRRCCHSVSNAAAE